MLLNVVCFRIPGWGKEQLSSAEKSCLFLLNRRKFRDIQTFELSFWIVPCKSKLNFLSCHMYNDIPIKPSQNKATISNNFWARKKMALFLRLFCCRGIAQNCQIVIFVPLPLVWNYSWKEGQLRSRSPILCSEDWYLQPMMDTWTGSGVWVPEQNKCGFEGWKHPTLYLCGFHVRPPDLNVV